MIHSPNFAKCLQETEFTFHCVWYIEPVYSTGRVAISQKANEIQFEFPTKMLDKMVVHNATILRSLPNFVDPSSFLRDLCPPPGTIHTFYRFRSTFAFVIRSTISSSKIISSTQNRVYSICIYNM